jgi:hypothetical protein
MEKVRIKPRMSSGVPTGPTIGGAEVRIAERQTEPPPRCEVCERRDEVILAEAREAQRYRDGLRAVAYEVEHSRKRIGESRTAQEQAAIAVSSLSLLAALCEALGCPP